MRLAWLAVMRSAWKALGHIRNELQQRKAGIDEAFAFAGLLGKDGSVVAGQVEQALEALDYASYCTSLLVECKSLSAGLPLRYLRSG
jgi:hypothetical protein